VAERLLKIKIRRWLKEDKDVFSFHYSAYMGKPGIPDILGYIKKRNIAIPFGIEAKKVGKDLSPVQKLMKVKFLYFNVPILSPCYSLNEVKLFITKLKE